MEELWKDVKDYVGLYEVSNLGRVKNTRTGRVLKPGRTLSGYKNVVLCKDGIHYNNTIHRLVAEAFIPNPDNLPQVNHKNEDKADNRVENLEWCTSKYNINYGSCIERSVKARSKTVYQYTLSGELVKVWDGVVTAANELNVCYTHICNCAIGKRKTAYGYRWSYVNDLALS